RTTLGMVEVVVDLTAMRGRTAPWESAMLIAGAQESLHSRGRNIVVCLNDHALRIEEDPIPTAGLPCKETGDVSGHRTVSVELAHGIGAAGQRGGGDGDLNGGLDGLERRL